MLRDTLSMVSLQFSMRCLLPFAWLPPKIRASRQDGLCVGTVEWTRELQLRQARQDISLSLRQIVFATCSALKVTR